MCNIDTRFSQNYSKFLCGQKNRYGSLQHRQQSGGADNYEEETYEETMDADQRTTIVTPRYIGHCPSQIRK